MADTTPPTRPTGLTATGGAGPGETDVDGGDRQRRRRPLQRPPLDHRRLHAERRATGSPSRPAASYTDTGLAAGTYYYRVTAEDAAGNIGPASNEASATVAGDSASASSPPTASTRAAARRRADQSGSGNNGTLANATWAGAGAGKFGNALTFNGTNASSPSPTANSLDLTTGMTLEAWVQADGAGSALPDGDREGAPGRPRLRRCTRTAPSNRPPIAEVYVGGYRDAVGTAAARRPASGRTSPPRTTARRSRLYVNGTQVGDARCRGLAHQLDGRRSASAATRSGASGSAA